MIKTFYGYILSLIRECHGGMAFFIGETMRQIEAMSFKMWFTRISASYKRMLNKDDGDGKLILRDIVGFSKLGLYEPSIEYTPEQLLELRGRQQMALHMLQHLDIDAVAMMQLQNEAYTQSNNLNED